MAPELLTKSVAKEIIRSTSDCLLEMTRSGTINDGTRTPLADLTKLVAGLMGWSVTA
jgi:hypothetical protein